MADHMHVLQINFLSYDEERNDKLIAFLWSKDRKYITKGSDQEMTIQWERCIELRGANLILFSKDKHDCKVIREFIKHAISEYCTKHGCNMSWKMLC